MKQNSGIKKLDYYELWQIADHILVNEAHNLPLQNWQVENYDKIMRANDYTFEIDFKTQEMAKLVSGQLLNTIVSNINAQISSETSNELFIYGIVSIISEYSCQNLNILLLNSMIVTWPLWSGC